jgi:CDP-glucose 4,6-dehydratase
VDETPRPHEAGYLKLDCSKARALLGWEPKWTLKRSIEAIVEWHKTYLIEHDARMVTLAQITEYQSTLEAQ